MKLIKPIFYAVVAILVLIIFSMVYFVNDGAGTATNLGLTLVYILLGLTILAAIVFPIRTIVQDPASGVRALIGVAAIGLIFLIGYAVSGDEVTYVYEKNGVTTAGASQLIGGAMNLMFITLAAIVGATIFSEVRNLIK